MKLSIGAVTSRPGLSLALHDFFADVESLRGETELGSPDTPFEHVLISLMDEPEGYLRDVTRRPPTHRLRIGCESSVFKVPLNRARVVAYLAERCEKAVGNSRRLTEREKEHFQSAIASWRSRHRF